MSDLTQSQILEECRVKLVQSVESQTGQQTVTIHILHNISRSKDN